MACTLPQAMEELHIYADYVNSGRSVTTAEQLLHHVGPGPEWAALGQLHSGVPGRVQLLCLVSPKIPVIRTIKGGTINLVSHHHLCSYGPRVPFWSIGTMGLCYHGALGPGGFCIMVLWDYGAFGPWCLGPWGYGTMGLWDHGALGLCPHLTLAPRNFDPT